MFKTPGLQKNSEESTSNKSGIVNYKIVNRLALPHLVKYIYNNGTDEVIRRGKKIFTSGYMELVEHNDLLSAVTFRVKDDAYNTYYKVYVSKFKDAKTL